MGSEVSCDSLAWSSWPGELQKFKEESWTFAEVVSGFGMMSGRVTVTVRVCRGRWTWGSIPVLL